MIRLWTEVGVLELTPDQARKAVEDLRAALHAHAEDEHRRARDARAADLWQQWLAAGALATVGGHLVRRTTAGAMLLRRGYIEGVPVPLGTLFARPVWSRYHPGNKAHFYQGPGLPVCGMGPTWRTVEPPPADGEGRYCKLCLRHARTK